MSDRVNDKGRKMKCMNQSFLSRRNCIPHKNPSQLKFDYKHYTQLKRALKEGKREIIQALLDQSCSVDVYPQDCDMRPLLHYSVYLGDPEVVKQLVDRGTSVNTKDLNNETALVLAAKFEKNELTDILLKASGLENCHNNENLSHLHIACMRNQVEVVKKLMRCKADVNEAVHAKSIFWPGYTALHFAVKFRCLETVEFLLQVGADITIKDARYLTPLHFADMVRNEPIIDVLLKAHKNFSVNPSNPYGLTHFHIACTRNNPEVVEFFIRNDVHSSAYHNPLNPYNWQHFGPMDMAIYYECIDVVELLLAHEFSVSSKSYDQIDHMKCAYHTGNTKLIDLLLTKNSLKKRGVDEKKTISVLHFYCIHNMTRSMESLSQVEVEKSLNSLTWQGSSPLHLAIENNSSGAISFLLHAGATCEMKNAGGKTPLHLAFYYNKSEIVDSILNRHLDYSKNPTDDDGVSHLHIACANNKLDVVQKFIDLGADVNRPVNSTSVSWAGFTALHFAVEFGSYEMVNLLLQNHASCTAVDSQGLTAFDLAIKNTCKISRRNEAFKLMYLIMSRRGGESLNNRGFSLMHLASFHKEKCDLKLLIEKNPPGVHAAIPRQNTPWDGYTPLHFMIEFGDIDDANLLIKEGANLLSKL